MTFTNVYKDRSDFDFEVGREQLHLRDGQYTGVDALVREDTGDFLSVVTPKYQVVTHKEANAFAEKLFERNNLNYEEGHISVNEKGTKFLREFRFTDMNFNPGTFESTALDYNGREDTHTPTVILRNSYDKSSSLDFIFGGFRMICSNGVIIGDTLQRIRYKHTQVPDFPKIGRQLLEGLENTVEGFKKTYTELNAVHADPYLQMLMEQQLLSAKMVAIMQEMAPDGIRVEHNKEGEIKLVEALPNLSAYALMQIVTEIVSHRTRKYSRAVQMQRQLAKVFTVS